jgi:phosphoribosylaminoimidazole-succinocarboxamide synthase
MTSAIVNNITERYIELYEKVSGEKFIKATDEEVAKRIEKNILKSLN